MQHRGWFDNDRWDRHGSRRRGPNGESSDPLEAFWAVVQQAALWAAGGLAVASLMPPALAAPLLRELLLLAAVFISLTAVARGERLSLRQFNRQDAALLLLAVALIAGFFVDPAAVEEALAESTAGAAAAGTAEAPVFGGV